MSVILVVVEPFADYAKGDRITDPDKIKSTMENQPNRVVRINDESDHGATQENHQ